MTESGPKGGQHRPGPSAMLWGQYGAGPAPKCPARPKAETAPHLREIMPAVEQVLETVNVPAQPR